MPARDGTGPRTVGRGMGLGRGRGVRQGIRGLGGVSECVCPKCGHKQTHNRGIPCTQVACPKCGTMMTGDFCRTDTK